MAINPDLLIAAPMLQDSFVDKDGTPMAGGTITCYQDNSRTTLKNWYYQSSNFADASGKYTFSPLPNPLTLSAAGTITDINGVDTIPFFYPYSEIDQTQAQPYYITIVNQAQTNQITRPNFPYNPQESNVDLEGSVQNYIINNVFWRNIGTINLQNITQKIVAPSQHDTFRYPDLQFLKTNTSGQDTLTFTTFPESTTPILTGDITPEFYINHTCSNTPSAETQKCYQFPLSLHVKTLSSVQFTCTIQAQNVGGTGVGQNVINLFLLQDTGTGTTSPVPLPFATITLNTGWTKYTFTGTTPNTSGLSLSTAGDDALYLQVQMPLNKNCSINFTKPSIYLSANAPNNDFSTYDQIDTVINSPRTGDVRISANDFYPYGWAPMNDGTLVNSGSITPPTNLAISYQGVDAWALYNLIWTKFSAYTLNGSPLIPIYTSAGSPSTYGASAYADWNALKQLSVSQNMGRVILGTVPVSALSALYTTTFTGSVSTITPANVINGFNGMPLYFTGTSTLTVNKIYYMGNYTGTTFQVFNTFANAISQTSPQTVDVSGTFVMAFNSTVEGEYAHTLLLNEMVNHTHNPLGGTGYWMNSSGQPQGMSGAAASGLSEPTTGSITGYGSQMGFNITQPGSFTNMFIKL